MKRVEGCGYPSLGPGHLRQARPHSLSWCPLPLPPPQCWAGEMLRCTLLSWVPESGRGIKDPPELGPRHLQLGLPSGCERVNLVAVVTNHGSPRKVT